MKFVIAVTVQSTLKANGQLIQRQKIREEIDLPDDEAFKNAFLMVGMPNPDGITTEVIISK